ncbi:four helix bundle protein [Chryseobacterium sp. H3056]|uniref:Four helix bundle protein n=2 Tax=Kaistella daneshvariae TaxID=2487074 RepID=A0A3N0WU08_9FLAO|nr:four helix bundle protein [Kaistella daneshvariae]
MMADIVRELSFQFALDAIQLYKFLTTEKREFVLSKQFLRSATSVGANLREAKNAQSAIDFIHKNAISQKECDEAIYWLELLFASEYISETTFNDLNAKATSLLKIIKIIIITKKQNLKNP